MIDADGIKMVAGKPLTSRQKNVLLGCLTQAFQPMLDALDAEERTHKNGSYASPDWIHQGIRTRWDYDRRVYVSDELAAPWREFKTADGIAATVNVPLTEEQKTRLLAIANALTWLQDALCRWGKVEEKLVAKAEAADEKALAAIKVVRERLLADRQELMLTIELGEDGAAVKKALDSINEKYFKALCKSARLTLNAKE